MSHAVVWRNTLLAVLLVSAVPLAVLAVLARREDAVRRAVPGFVCFAVGALLGAAFFQLIPEAYEGAIDASARRAVPATVLAGYGVFLLLEWLLHGVHGQHDPQRAPHAHGRHAHGHHGHLPSAPDASAQSATDPQRAGELRVRGRTARARRRRTLVTLNLVGDATHNLLDGVLLAATFLSNPAVGVLTTIAVSMHEVPRELGSFGVFVHGGVAVRRAVLYNVWTAMVSLAGAMITLAIGTHTAGVARALLPFAAGNFLYIAASLLVPLLRRPGSRAMVLGRMVLIALGLVATGVPALFR